MAQVERARPVAAMPPQAPYQFEPEPEPEPDQDLDDLPPLEDDHPIQDFDDLFPLEPIPEQESKVATAPSEPQAMALVTYCLEMAAAWAHSRKHLARQARIKGMCSDVGLYLFQRTDMVMMGIIDMDDSLLMHLIFLLAGFLRTNEQQLPALHEPPPLLKTLDVNTDRWTHGDVTTLATLCLEGQRLVRLCQDLYIYFLPVCNMTLDLAVVCDAMLKTIGEWVKVLAVVDAKQRLGYTPLWAGEPK